MIIINVTNAIATALSITGVVDERSFGVADGDVKVESDKEGVAGEQVTEGVGG